MQWQATNPAWRLSAKTICQVGLASWLPLALGGCYQHVVSAGQNTAEERSVHQANREDDEPDWLDELMWGPPPKGQDAKAYYRSKKMVQP